MNAVGDFLLWVFVDIQFVWGYIFTVCAIVDLGIDMPTVLQVGPYSFVFFSSDRPEPPHIHVKRDRQIAKFWLVPISLATNRGFEDHELNDIVRLIEERQQRFLEA